MIKKAKKILTLLPLLLMISILTPLKASSGPHPADLIVINYDVYFKQQPSAFLEKDANFKCKLKGYLGGSIYQNKYGARGELKPYTACFFYGITQDKVFFYIAKPYNRLNGFITALEPLKLVYSQAGNIMPKNAAGSDVCLSPWILPDNILSELINQVLKEHVPYCK
jgi:hypothetical protein